MVRLLGRLRDFFKHRSDTLSQWTVSTNTMSSGQAGKDSGSATGSSGGSTADSRVDAVTGSKSGVAARPGAADGSVGPQEDDMGACGSRALSALHAGVVIIRANAANIPQCEVTVAHHTPFPQRRAGCGIYAVRL